MANIKCRGRIPAPPTMMITVTIGALLVLVHLGQPGRAEIWPKWMDIQDNITDLGNLCEPDNDVIGRKLGCDCDYPFLTPGRNLYADCNKETLGVINMELPLRINVSRHVRKIIFAKNFITRLDGNTFGAVEGVDEADFSKNQIRTVNDLSFPRLTKLDLSYNSIVNLTNDAFKNCAKLQYLDLSFNQLTFIEPNVFSQLSYLKALNLASNQIGIASEYHDQDSFSLFNLEWLEQLNLSNNSFRDFPTKSMDGASTVKQLYLQNNLLLVIPLGTFSHFENLELLDLSGNLFNTLGRNYFHGLKSLQTLILDGNRELTMIESHAFSGLPELRELSCQRNHRLTAIDGFAFKADPTLQEVNDTTPTTVRFGSNALTSFEGHLLNWADLEYLDLSRNPWVCDCELQWVAELKENKLTEASMLIDSDFVCEEPPQLKGIPVATVEADEMLCYSSTASIVGIVGIVLFCLVLVVFCTLLGLHALGIMPERLKKIKFFGNPLKRYSRVDAPPKPGNRFSRNGTDVELSPDLEWDNGDMGRI